MEEKARDTHPCFNLKMPDPQCQDCLWLEWDRQGSSCKNRNKIICSLYVEEVFGALHSSALN